MIGTVVVVLASSVVGQVLLDRFRGAHGGASVAYGAGMAVCLAGFGAGLFVLVSANHRRRLRRAGVTGDDGTLEQVRRAVREGRAPADPAVDEAVLRYVAHRRRVRRWAVWVVPGLFLLTGMLELLNILVGGGAMDWFMAVLFPAYAAGTVALFWQEGRRLRRAEAAVRGRRGVGGGVGGR
ncbi:hypothetical protein [Actinomadura parmotrematis]|uniref:Integral membrane protein n=1 Tax=Actinomadura parmotrematis TaxID=2864039 RepID=A0ABS7FPY9_9ACTN|nr:hypothetical protein [Actinomadura parmotrematis]MBW8481632.1 hypothetical protein [Actinomadura parmotrematis]